MAKVLWIATYRSVSDPDALAEYAKLAAPALQAAGGRFIARGVPVAVKESGLMQRTVVIEFDSKEQALTAYDSSGYADALHALGKGSVDRDIRIVELIE
jgi:uncharacterized protein (DUF1330 family)